MVKWEDSNHDPKTLGLKAHPVTLWVGARKKDRIWVAMLQSIITFEYSCRSKPFQFYMFLDPRTLPVQKDPLTGTSTILLLWSSVRWLSAVTMN